MGSVYYVSSLGDDKNNGTSENDPWKTLARASTQSYLPGDALLLKAGDMWEEPLILQGAGEKKRPILVSSYGQGERPMIRYGCGDVLSLINPSYLIVRGLAIHCATELPLFPEQKNFYEKSNNHNRKTSKYRVNRGIGLEFAHGGTYTDILIEDNVVTGPGPDSFSVGIEAGVEYLDDTGGPLNSMVHHIVIQKNLVGHLGWVGIQTCAWYSGERKSIPQHLFRNARILSNTVQNIGVQGLLLRHATQSILEWNIVRQAGMYKGPGVEWGPAGLWVWGCRDVDLRFNEVCGMMDSNSGYDGTGIDIDWHSESIRVRCNHVHDNFGNGIVTMACRNSEIIGNRIEGNHCIYNCGTGQIGLTNYHQDNSPDAIRNVENLTVADNLILLDRKNTCAFNTLKSSAGPPWTGNIFVSNRIVNITGTPPSMLYEIKPDAWVEAVQNNLFYGFEEKDYPLAAAENTFTPLPDDPPPVCSSLSAVPDTSGTGVLLAWKLLPGGGKVQHFNIHRAETPDFAPAYTNMLGQTSASHYLDESPPSHGICYYKVYAEDCCGAYGPVSEAKVDSAEYAEIADYES